MVIKIVTIKSITIFFSNLTCFSDKIELILFPVIQISIEYIIVKIIMTKTEKLTNCFNITQNINNEQKTTDTLKNGINFKTPGYTCNNNFLWPMVRMENYESIL